MKTRKIPKMHILAPHHVQDPRSENLRLVFVLVSNRLLTSGTRDKAINKISSHIVEGLHREWRCSICGRWGCCRHYVQLLNLLPSIGIVLKDKSCCGTASFLRWTKIVSAESNNSIVGISCLLNFTQCTFSFTEFQVPNPWFPGPEHPHGMSTCSLNYPIIFRAKRLTKMVHVLQITTTPPRLVSVTELYKRGRKYSKL